MPTQLASYNFSTIENPLSDGGNFSTGPSCSAMQVPNPGVCQGSAALAVCHSIYTGIAWPDDQYSEVTLLLHLDGSSTMFVSVRADASVNTNYSLNMLAPLGSAGTPQIFKTIAGSSMLLVTGASVTFNIGDVIRFLIQGTSLHVFQNGVEIPSLAVSDASIAAGNPGFGVFAASVAQETISAWAGGSALSPPPPGLGVVLVIME